ncbi:hypothetical protein HLB03_10120 [Acidianus sp. DSM 29099]|nr:hypothetical protein [Acidianus sp. RZ1]
MSLILLTSIELTILSILTISISNYDLLKYPFGLTQQLPPLYWITEFFTAISFLLPIIFFKKIDKKIYNYLTASSLLLFLFDTFFIFYFINPVFVLTRDELGHSAEVFLLLHTHTTLLNLNTYQAYYPLGFIYGAISYLMSGISPTAYFIFFGPSFFSILQILTVYGVIRLFLNSPRSELGIFIYMLSSMPFYVAEWSPQLMSYNLLFPIFLIIALIVKKGGVRLIPLMILLTGLTGLTDVGTFGSAITLALGGMLFIRKTEAFKLKHLIYSFFTGVSIFLYWFYFNPIASGALGGVHVLFADFFNTLEALFIPQATKSLSLPASHLIYTFIPESQFHFISVASKLIDGGIFLLLSIFAFLIIALKGKADKYTWLLFGLGTSLLIMQSAIGLADNVSNVLTRMIPQVMVFYSVIIVLYLKERRMLPQIFAIALLVMIPLSILGYAMIATSEHSTEAAFCAGKFLGKYEISSVSTYGFYVSINKYMGTAIPPDHIFPKDIEYAGPYIETLSVYFNGPNTSGYDKYYNEIIQNHTIFLNSGDMIVAINYPSQS